MDSVSFEKDLGKMDHAFSQLEILGFSLDIIWKFFFTVLSIRHHLLHLNKKQKPLYIN